MKPARLPTSLALQLTNPQGFWYRVHPAKCRRRQVLRVSISASDRFERAA